MSVIKYEIACFDFEQAVRAFDAGADRIELCSNKPEGGVTPSYGLILKAGEDIKVPVNVIIRPRGGDYCYTEREFVIMKKDIEICKSAGINGVVFGILDTGNGIDEKRNRILVETAYPLETTFHRAFDLSPVPEEDIERIIKCGFTRLLTSGCKRNAAEGVEIISRLADIAGNRIIVMPGGGVRKDNIQQIYEKTKAAEYHSSSAEIIGSIKNYYE